MRDISFFSEDSYLYLPSEKNPRVILAVSNSKISKNSYKLYNPFSAKAKFLKTLSQFLLINTNSLTRRLAGAKSYQKSDFVGYLEDKLKTKLTTSIYMATVQDKVVLQLQSNNKIYGYLKFPLNESGIKNIEHEKRAIIMLSENNIVAPFVLADAYKNIPYMILPELRGSIGDLSDNVIIELVSKLKKEKKLKLTDHQRVKALYKDLEVLQLKSYKPIMDTIVQNSTTYYYEAFEHGDFTPWNIVKTDNGPELFDFEFFVENGLEYFDLIKYHFQIGRLLKKMNFKELSSYVSNKIDIPEIKEVLILFLIKEIIKLKKTAEPCQFQDNMLNHICE